MERIGQDGKGRRCIVKSKERKDGEGKKNKDRRNGS